MVLKRTFVLFFIPCWYTWHICTYMYKNSTLSVKPWCNKSKSSKVSHQMSSIKHNVCFLIHPPVTLLPLRPYLLTKVKIKTLKTKSHFLSTGPNRKYGSSHKNRGYRLHNADTMWINNDSNNSVCSRCCSPSTRWTQLTAAYFKAQIKPVEECRRWFHKAKILLF